jgi:integrase/recombinase XerD
MPNRQLGRAGLEKLPATIARSGERAAWRFPEFFTANIRNKNTWAAYAEAVTQFFRWCEARRLELEHLNPTIVAAGTS